MTESNGNGAAAGVSSKRPLLALIDAVRGRKVSYIQVHNNPDPDAISSAVGMRYIYERYLGIPSRIVFGGIVGRAENRAMLRLLGIQLVPCSKIDYNDCDLLTLVDTQPGAGHTDMPKGRVPEVVIDHHPARAESNGALYWDVGRPMGATATIVAEMILRNHMPLPRDVATALMYGIKSDTHDLSQEASPTDLAVYQMLFGYGDTATLAQIENARVPRSYYAVYQRAIQNALIYDFATVSHLGRIDNPDMVAEMADFLLRCEDLRWSLVTGIFENTLHLSLRGTSKNAHAGRIARKAVGVMGSAGGHGHMAGGQIPLGECDRATRMKIVNAVTDLFLDAIKAKKSLMMSLTDDALPEETDTSVSIDD
ncbi:MAG: DHH family phosphoesterase [Planctomycetota bacterium]|jgi:nanoRNase/pAp phosphatase (c-di-AMP/oligoRNAs hydrolase)